MARQIRQDRSAHDDDGEDQSADSGFRKWGLGIILPLGIGCYGLYGIVFQEMVLMGRYTSIVLHGPNAIALGIAWLSAAGFLYSEFFLNSIYDQAWFAVFGKILSGCGFIAGLAYLLIRVGVQGVPA